MDSGNALVQCSSMARDSRGSSARRIVARTSVLALLVAVGTACDSDAEVEESSGDAGEYCSLMHAARQSSREPEVMVAFEPDATDEEVQAVKGSVEEDADVVAVELRSKEQSVDDVIAAAGQVTAEDLEGIVGPTLRVELGGESESTRASFEQRHATEPSVRRIVATVSGDITTLELLTGAIGSGEAPGFAYLSIVARYRDPDAPTDAVAAWQRWLDHLDDIEHVAPEVVRSSLLPVSVLHRELADYAADPHTEVDIAGEAERRRLVDDLVEATDDLCGAAGDESPAARRRAVRESLMPDLVGVDLNTLGDVEGVLYDLQEVLGVQVTINVANEAPEGLVIEQVPAPGTPLDEVKEWTLTVSAGGPVVDFADLPPDVIAFARRLTGMDVDEPLVKRITDLGAVYKTDRWLFGLDCAAVDAAYRTFGDARYDTTCPERFDGSGG
jgi:hypothetical protein